jgi:predicted GNAT family N-acyltransferase
MFQGRVSQTSSGFRKIGFSEKVWSCLDRARRSDIQLCAASYSEATQILGRARQSLTIASNELVAKVMTINPSAVQVVKNIGVDESSNGLLAILPLNVEGTTALIRGRFDGLLPDLRWICGPDEWPDSLYVWLVYMPCTFGRTLGAISDAIDTLVQDACPMFSRGVNEHSARLHNAAGFRSAKEFYPECQSDLLVVFPEAASLPKTLPKLEVRLARTIDDVFKVFSVRSATYIAEQFCLYDEEFDGNDFCATHFIGTVDGDAAGCVRLRFFEGFAKLERLAVRAEYRQSRLAYKLVREALEHCKRKGYRKVLGHSRLDLVRFWKVFGFRPVETRAQFAFANVQYAEILLEQEADDHAIRIDADPMIIIRPEGAWEKPGPFDVSISALDPKRKQLIEARTRTIRRQKIVA